MGLFDKSGKTIDKNGYDKNGYDKNGYDKNGYDKNGYDKNGYDKKGYTKEEYAEESQKLWLRSKIEASKGPYDELTNSQKQEFHKSQEGFTQWFEQNKNETKETNQESVNIEKDIIEYESKTQKIESDKIEDTQKSISELIKSSESETLEFKSTLKWDIRENRANSSLVLGCVKTIAGFLNNRGGILIVGYDDDNEVVHGLEKDYPHMGQRRCNYDGWQQYFISQINDKLGKTINRYFTIEPIPYNGKTLAKIRVQSSPEPVFTKHDNTEGNFFVRIHGQTEKLNPQETQKWILGNFKK
jgi:hypothetical protein